MRGPGPLATCLPNCLALPVRDIFDVDHFIAAMRGQGMQVVTQAPEGARTARFNLALQFDALGTIRGAGIGVHHVRWGRQSGEGQGA